ncbi:hypothetical protein C448_02988 [Halococcus morrhuae DSM 1307]|uniref:DUF2178 domain-containing protein n=1 Tax=Halococcus morrhuae DSM 1307 TaxID=931277 RepID=M0MWI2_HALMO|nr:hypothetical protein [Halococcus morrhuae]EMA48800.1 hypothetical protein C448_02988 [Halococcus morrhuae DSM 1307]
MVGVLLAGVAIGLALRSIGYPFVGEAVYWLGIISVLAIWRSTSLTLFDERDQELERRTAMTTLSVFAAVLVIGASATRVLAWAGIYTVPPVLAGALYGYVVLFLVALFIGAWYRYRG